MPLVSSNFRRLAATAACAASCIVGCTPKGDAIAQAEKSEKDAPGIVETKAIAEEGFIYGLPIVMNYAVMNEFAVDAKSSQFKAPFNEIKSERHVATYKDTAVVTPNSDTPYSILWVDLRAEPMVISVPSVPKDRYYSVQMIDGNAYNYGYIGSRATGTEPGDYLIAGPDWKGASPEGIKKVFSSTTPFSLCLFRTQLFDPEDMPEVAKVQAGYKAQPLSAFLKKPAPPAAPKVDFVPATTAGIKEHFYEYLDAALQFVPITPENKEIRAKLARIGVGPGKSFDFKSLSLEHKAAVLLAMKEGDDKVDEMLAMKEGDDKVDEMLASGLSEVNGWKIGAVFGDSAFYNGNWLLRAAAAKGGIYGNDAAEAVYPMTRWDAAGATLDGSKHDYTITFPKDGLPPVNAFWSVTMYDGKSQLLVENPIGRYLVNSPMLPSMKKNEDGSVTIYVQKASPGPEKESNWLPAPADTIYLVLRLYWPKSEQPSILPAGKGDWKPPAVVKVR